MAIKGSYTKLDGTEYPECYGNIKRAGSADHNTRIGSFYLDLYVSAELKDEQKPPCDNDTISVTGADFDAVFAASQNWRIGAYEHLKKFGKYSNWENV